MSNTYALDVNLPLEIQEEVRSMISRRILVDDNGCWNWQGFVKPNGYAGISFKKGVYNGHRLSFAAFSGIIPRGMVIDHLCRNRRCLNPFHMEVVTFAENCRRGIGPTAQNSRKVLCKRGHALTPLPDKRKIKQSARRYCHVCELADARVRSAEARRRKKEGLSLSGEEATE